MEVEDGYSWMVLPDRHPVLASDGEVVGYAVAVLGEDNGRFDGVVVGIDLRLAADPQLLLEVDNIVALGHEGIRTDLSADALRQLPEYMRDTVWHPSRKRRIARAFDDSDGSSAWDKK